MVNELFVLLMAMNVTTVHLTFDDGPNPAYTRQILSILRENHMQANFFLVGNNVKEYPEIVKEIVEDGNDIGGHSMSHKQLTKIPFDKAEHEILDSMDLVNQYQKSDLFRFPYGSFNPKLVSVLDQHGYINVYWDVDTVDWKYKDKSVIYKKFKVNVMRAPDGSVILMHDIHPQSVQVLKMIVQYLKEHNVKVTKLGKTKSFRGENYEHFWENIGKFCNDPDSYLSNKRQYWDTHSCR